MNTKRTFKYMMQGINRRNAIKVALLSFSAVYTLNAQEPVKAQEDAYREKVVIMAPYQPGIHQVDKPLFSPATDDTTFTSKKPTYSVLSRPVKITYPTENIKPATVAGEPLEKLYNSRIRIGFGFPVSPLGELLLNMGRNKTYEGGLSVFHHSTFGKIKNYAVKPDDMYTSIGAYGALFTDPVSMSLNLFYDNEQVNCYGVSDDRRVPVDLEPLKPIRQYDNIGGTFKIQDNNTEADAYKYEAGASYNATLDNWYGAESDILLNGKMSKDLGGIVPRSDFFAPGVDASFDMFLVRAFRDDPTMFRFAFRVEPTLKYKYLIYELDASLRLNIYNEDKVKVQFNPVAKLQIHAVENILTPYVGIDGGIKRLTMRELIKINPFLNPYTSTQLAFMKNKFEFYVGLKGAFSKNIEYDFRADAARRVNFLNFDYYRYPWGNTTYGYNDFIPIYADVWNVNVRGEVSFRWDERIRADVSATYHYYDKLVYYRPAFEAKVNFRYNLSNKLILKTEIVGYTNMKALDEYGQEAKLKGSFDWSLGGEYRFNDRWSVFLDLNNLIAQRYFKWYDYPSYRFNFMLGGSFNF